MKKGGGGGGERLVGLYIDDIFLCMHNCLCMCVGVCKYMCGRVIGDECVSSVLCVRVHKKMSDVISSNEALSLTSINLTQN